MSVHILMQQRQEERVVPVRQVLVQVAVQLLHLEVQLLQVQV